MFFLHLECVNKYGDDALCEMFSLIGECDNNPEWMLENCRKSCWKCDNKEPGEYEFAYTCTHVLLLKIVLDLYCFFLIKLHVFC